MPGSLILLLVVAPNLFAHTFRDSWVGTVICLLIGCYLLQEHIRASGGFRNSFTQSNGISNTVGIILLLVYPIWALVLRAVWWTTIMDLNVQCCEQTSSFTIKPMNKWIWFCVGRGLNISGYVIMYFWHIKYLWLINFVKFSSHFCRLQSTLVMLRLYLVMLHYGKFYVGIIFLISRTKPVLTV